MISTNNTAITNKSSHHDLLIPHVEISFVPNTANSYVDAFPLSLETFLFVTNTPLPGSTLFLHQSLLARLEATRDGFIMKSSYIDEESFGETLEEVYLDFLTSIRDRYYSLSHREQSLSSHDRSILDNIRTLLQLP